MPSNNHPKASRRSVLKKSAVAITAGVGGVTTVGSASASADASVQISGVGDFEVVVDSDSYDIQADGEWTQMDMKSDPDGSGYVWKLYGEVSGEPNSDGEHAYITFDGFDEKLSQDESDGVDYDWTIY